MSKAHFRNCVEYFCYETAEPCNVVVFRNLGVASQQYLLKVLLLRVGIHQNNSLQFDKTPTKFICLNPVLSMIYLTNYKNLIISDLYRNHFRPFQGKLRIANKCHEVINSV